MSKTKRRQSKEYWDKKKRSRPREKHPAQEDRKVIQEPKPQQGLRLPSPKAGDLSLLEAKNGMLVQVPDENLEAWEEAQQNEAEEPLNSGELQLLDKVLEMLYGKEEK